jgi:hypothetical protein
MASPQNTRDDPLVDLEDIRRRKSRPPGTYLGQYEIVISGITSAILPRNILLLLTALHFPLEKAVLVMIHLWYSALIPAIRLS